MRDLPARVQKDFAELQYKSELLVAGLQLAVLALLAIIYYSSPEGFSPDAPLRSAPLGLGFFSILVFVRLWFAWTRQLTPVFLAFSVVAEMLILMFTIWTYHLQFETMASINLKNPHVSYVFVLIALRALRFEPLWVILSGLTGALGWAAIVIYAWWEPQGINIITWDYVTYASSRSLHPAAEMDKILSILLVTGLIAFTLQRARQTLVTAVTQTQSSRELSRFLDDGVAAKITGAENLLQAGFGETRKAAIIFFDLRGFTKASANLTPTGLIGLLGEYHGLIVPIIQKNGGNIDKYMGDGVLASFGAVEPSETYAADALRCVEQVMEDAARWADQRKAQGLSPIAIGAGVAVGDLVFGVIGNAGRLEYTVIGETVNLAAKLEKHNKVLSSRALAPKETYLTALQQGYKDTSLWSAKDNLQVDGLTNPISLNIYM